MSDISLITVEEPTDLVETGYTQRAYQDSMLQRA